MRTAILTAFLAGALASAARADERKFTYSYEAKTLPKGSLEFEQWATVESRKRDGEFRDVTLREELEYGVSDRLTAALYLNYTWQARRDVTGVKDHHDVEFDGISLEGKYKLWDPSVDPVGLLGYLEVGLDNDEREVEAKIVVNKIVGSFNLVYNFVFEFEHEEEREPDGEREFEKELVISHTIGASYAVSPQFAVGVEALSHQDFEEDFGDQEHLAYFAGPNLHYAEADWWITITALKQVDIKADTELDLDGHTKYEFRVIIGVNF
jgi:hypothetical protein